MSTECPGTFPGAQGLARYPAGELAHRRPFVGSEFTGFGRDSFPRPEFDRARLADFALKHQIPSMFVFREWVDAGGLLCYGPSITALFARVAEFVDRIARGAAPSDLPIEQPTKFEMVVNLKTAKAIGVDLPTAILLRADEVIE